MLYNYCKYISRGYLGPGGLHDGAFYANCTGGATGYIDKTILGLRHLYQTPTATIIYRSEPFDPEGVFGTLFWNSSIFSTPNHFTFISGTLNSIVQVFIGVQAGTTLLIFKSHASRLTRWLLWAILTGVVGGVLCGFSKEDGVIPLNKNLW